MASGIQSQSICGETLCGCLLEHGLGSTENVLGSFVLQDHGYICRAVPFSRKKNLKGFVIIEESLFSIQINGAHGFFKSGTRLRQG